MEKLKELPKDIIEEMKIRFDSDFDAAMKILTEYRTNNDYLDSDRVIRCVIFLTKNGIESFEENLTLAKTDSRDVMLWAEYEYPNKRIRNFDNEFGNEKI